MVMKVRPWKPPAKATTAERLVAARAILIAFSTASAPVENRIDLAGPAIGASALSRSHSAMYGRSEAHPSALQSLMRTSSAVLSLKQKYTPQITRWTTRHRHGSTTNTNTIHVIINK